MEKLIQTISHTCACFHYIIFFDINTTVLYKDQKEGLHVKAKNYHVYNIKTAWIIILLKFKKLGIGNTQSLHSHTTQIII